MREFKSSKYVRFRSSSPSIPRTRFTPEAPKRDSILVSLFKILVISRMLSYEAPLNSHALFLLQATQLVSKTFCAAARVVQLPKIYKRSTLSDRYQTQYKYSHNTFRDTYLLDILGPHAICTIGPSKFHTFSMLVQTWAPVAQMHWRLECFGIHFRQRHLIEYLEHSPPLL